MFIQVNEQPAMSGHFAILWGQTTEDGMTFWEPYETGLGRYATIAEAEAEAKQWAEDIGVEFKPLK